jgi:nitroimidazol reductase NimA-like FMN-containing flavoprotein (pyridoxamine 5'-phosphate oxidase superfamily)
MSTTMTQQEKEAFLAAVHVGVLSIPREEQASLTVPVWYGYEAGGEIWFVTGRDSHKGRLLSLGRCVSLCVQDEQPPYKYVPVEGTVSAVKLAEVERDVRPLAHRYLGRERGDQYIAMAGFAEAREENLLVCVRPQRWLAVDYAKELQI